MLVRHRFHIISLPSTFPNHEARGWLFRAICQNNLAFWAHSKKIPAVSTLELSQAKSRLLQILRLKSVFHGDFILASGAKSNYYIDCRLTTLDAEAAALVGQVIYSLIQERAQESNVSIKGVGGLTMGADPIALATGMQSFRENPSSPIQPFVVRKAPKSHGQTKLIEGNFKVGDKVVVIDDVVTKGDSTIAAIEAVKREGGDVAFVVVLVDRQQGGREKIEALGYSVISAFTKDDLLSSGK
jgi:orotate phosphoribosyltransferase